jgi:hypothetical protein
MTIIREAEELAASLDTAVYDWTFHAVVLRRVKSVRSALAYLGVDPDHAAQAFENYTRKTAEASPSPRIQ